MLGVSSTKRSIRTSHLHRGACGPLAVAPPPPASQPAVPPSPRRCHRPAAASPLAARPIFRCAGCLLRCPGFRPQQVLWLDSSTNPHLLRKRCLGTRSGKARLRRRAKAIMLTFASCFGLTSPQILLPWKEMWCEALSFIRGIGGAFGQI